MTIENPKHTGIVPVQVEGPGIYTLPDYLLLKNHNLSPEYIEYCAYIRAFRSPIIMIKYLLSRWKIDRAQR